MKSGKSAALESLRHHGGTHPDSAHPDSRRGFLGMLREFDGGLDEANFHEVMAALKVWAGELRQGGQVDRHVIAALWSICHLGRELGVDPGGLLRRDGRITPDQVRTLKGWIRDISWASLALLEGHEPETAFGDYQGGKLTKGGKALAAKAKPKLNKAWHERNKLASGATLAVRARWHGRHSKACGCRPMPKAVKGFLERKESK